MIKRSLKRRLGPVFAETIGRVKPGSRVHKNGSLKQDSWDDSLLYGFNNQFITSFLSSWRRAFLLLIFLVTFFGLFLRLFHLQVIEGKTYRELADSNRVKVRIIHAPRGVIYDRNGKILAQNEPGFRLTQTDGSGAIHTQLISRDQALKMEADNSPQFKDLEIDSLRAYPMASVTAHILGYMGEIAPDELRSSQFANYRVGDQIGRGGIEQTYEKILRGIDGGEVIEVDAEGKTIRTLTKTDPISGQDLYLTIDANLEEQAYKQLSDALVKNKSCCGTAMVSDPNNGQILALVSLPSFDPGKLTESLQAGNFPFLDRAIAGTYPPGSTFKIVSSLAGLESGKITPETIIQDNGVTSLGPYQFTNWYFTQYGRTEGPVDLVKALQRSNDTYFYNLGEIVGENQIATTARSMGFGKPVGIDLPGEVSGDIPDDAWKAKNIGVVWYPGDTLHMAIGQGYTLVTPIQILNMTSIIAANGQSFPLHLASKITNADGSLVKQFEFKSSSIAKVTSQQIQVVQQGLDLVPKFGGTAWPLFTFPIPTAGKTGTAEFGNEDKTHAWYTSYAPADHPQIAATVLVEGGGEGSNVAAPVIKELYRYYFSPDKAHLIKDTNDIATDSGKSLGE